MLCPQPFADTCKVRRLEADHVLMPLVARHLMGWAALCCTYSLWKSLSLIGKSVADDALSRLGRPPMTLKIFVAAALFVVVPIFSFAQSDKPNVQSAKPTIEDARRLVETISSDKDKLKAYCEIGKLREQLDNAEEKGDAKEFEELVAKLDSLEQQMGPDYIRVMDGLGDVDPDSAEGQKFSAVLEPLRKQCGPGRVRT